MTFEEVQAFVQDENRLKALDGYPIASGPAVGVDVTNNNCGMIYIYLERRIAKKAKEEIKAAFEPVRVEFKIIGKIRLA